MLGPGGTSLAGGTVVAVNAYQPRGAEGTILHRLVRDHLETLLRDAAERTDEVVDRIR